MDYELIAIRVAEILSVGAAAVFIQSFFIKKAGGESIKELHDVTGNYLQIAATLYSVILGLFVYNAMDSYQEARLNSEKESNSIFKIYVLSMAFRDKVGDNLRSDIETYAREIRDKDWQSAGTTNGYGSNETTNALDKMTLDFLAIEPTTELQKSALQTMIDNLITSGELRRLRLDYVKYGIPRIQWITILLGGVITLIFTLPFFVKNQRIRILMTFSISVMISMNLYLVYVYNKPYTGDMKISSERFEFILNVMDQYKQHLKQGA